MGQPEADESCLHVPLVTSGLTGDALDAGEAVAFTAREKSEMTGCLGCPWIEGQQGAWPGTAQLP